MKRFLPALAIAAALCGLSAPGTARAAPTFSLLTPASPTRGITSVAFDNNASALALSTVSATFSDGSQVSTGFSIRMVRGGLTPEFVAQAESSAFMVLAFTSSDPQERPLFEVHNLDPLLTLRSIRIDGRGAGGGHAAFDLPLGANGLDEGTPGSSRGLALAPLTRYPSSIGGNLIASFLDPLALAGAAAVGDLFGSLQIDFDFESSVADFTGLPPPSQFNGVFSRFDFMADLDTVSYAAVTPPKDPPTDPPTGTVPEPGSAALLGLAACLGLRARRRAAARVTS